MVENKSIEARLTVSLEVTSDLCFEVATILNDWVQDREYETRSEVVVKLAHALLAKGRFRLRTCQVESLGEIGQEQLP